MAANRLLQTELLLAVISFCRSGKQSRRLSVALITGAIPKQWLECCLCWLESVSVEIEIAPCAIASRIFQAASCLVLYLTADGNERRGDGDAEIFLHVFRPARIDAQQDAAQERGLRLRQDLLNNHVGALAKSVDGGKNGLLRSCAKTFTCGRSIMEYTPCLARQSA